MRRFRRPPPQSLFSGREFSRLMSMFLMLGVLWMMISRARDPDVWRWLASDVDGGKKTAAPDDDEPPEAVLPAVAKAPEQKPAESTAADLKPGEPGLSEPKPGETSTPEGSNPAAKPVATAASQFPPEDFEKLVPGPTDEDEEERDGAKEQFQAITDRDVLAAVEMPLYWRLVKWTRAQTFDQLWKRAKTVSYVQLWESPDEYRGKLIRLKTLHLRQAFKWPATENSAGLTEIYDARGSTEDSKVYPYIVLFCDRPPKLPLGADIFEEATFVGYFFKQMSYRDGLDTRRAAPILIGRLRWQENVARQALHSNRSQAHEVWPVLIGGGVFLAGIIGLWIYRARHPRKRNDLALDQVEEKDVEKWIDQIGQDEAEEELQAGNRRPKYANGRKPDSKPLDWTDPGLHDETFPGFHEDSN